MHNDSGISAFQFLFFVCVGQYRQSHSFNAQRRLDDVGNIFFVGHGIDVGKILSGVFDMLFQVVIGPVGYAPQLAPTEREQKFKVGGRFGIESEFLFFVIPKAKVLALYAQTQ